MALDVPSGVRAFADEFLKLMEVYREQQAENLMKAFQERDAAQGEVDFSNLHMQSLVQLLSSPDLCQALRRTGLSILMSVVRMLPYPSQQVHDGADALAWLRTGVPEMVIELVSASDAFATADDAVVCECLSVAIELLEKGKRAAQDAFLALFRRHEQVRLFQNIRERLIRAERGLATFVATFNRVGAEMAEACASHGHCLTIVGIEEIAREDRACASFVGAHPGKVLRFLQLLCEGHNMEMQQYMRHQGKTSTDLVTCASDFLAVCARHVCPASMPLVGQCVDTLVEFVQNPCYNNQKGLVDTQLPHVAHQFLQMTAEHPLPFDDAVKYAEGVSALKTKSVTLLLSLLERVEDPFVPSRILKALDIDRLVAALNTLRAAYLGEDADDEGDEAGEIADQELSESASFQVACSLFMLFMMLTYYDETGELARKCNKKHIQDIVRLRANCGFVEISRDGRLERVFFQIPSVCRYLTNQAKENILREVNRDNHQDQMLDLVERGQVRYEEMVHLQNLNRSLVYQTFHRFSQHIDKLFFLNALVINCIMLAFFSYRDKQYMTLLSMSNITIDPAAKEALLILTALQMVISVTRMVGYYVEAGVLRVNRIFKSNEEYSKVAENLFGGPRYYFLFYKILLTDAYFILLFVFAATNVAALALQISSPLFFFLISFHLVDMFNYSPSLQTVTTAVSSRVNTLLQTTGLAFVMMYIYGAIGFVFFAEKFEFEEAEIQDGYRQVYNVNSARCDTIWKCFLVTVDMGLRKGDIGGAIDDIQWRDLLPGSYLQKCESVAGLEYLGCLGLGGDDVSPFIFLRIFYTSSFFIFINTILINIIFGVIIDTFSDLREQKEEMDEEMQHRCFICGLERYRLEINSADGNGFERHIREDHNMWVYVYFMVHLLRKDVTEHTGFESYVFDKLNEVDEKGDIRPKIAPDVTWFPCNEAMVLKETHDAKLEVRLSRRLELLNKSATNFVSHAMTHLQTVMSALERRKAQKPVESTSEGSDEEDDDDDDDDAGRNSPFEEVGVSTKGVLGAATGVFSQMALASGMALAGNRPDPVDPSGKGKYGPALEMLADEGFDNEEVNSRLLEEYRGDVEQVKRVLEEGGGVWS